MKQEPSPLAALVVGAIVVAAFILAYRSFSRRRKSGNNAGVLKPDTKITIGKVPEDETVVSLNKVEDEEQLRPSELYSKAMEKLSKAAFFKVVVASTVFTMPLPRPAMPVAPGSA